MSGKNNFAPLQTQNASLSSGVMVALRILVPPVRVRVLPGQQRRLKENFLSGVFVVIALGRGRYK
mgnify:CR=1 FL=1